MLESIIIAIFSAAEAARKGRKVAHAIRPRAGKLPKPAISDYWPLVHTSSPQEPQQKLTAEEQVNCYSRHPSAGPTGLEPATFGVTGRAKFNGIS
jgi:hypothetical protein